MRNHNSLTNQRLVNSVMQGSNAPMRQTMNSDEFMSSSVMSRPRTVQEFNSITQTMETSNHDPTKVYRHNDDFLKKLINKESNK